MNYLEICQKVNSAVGLQGTITTVVGTSGYQQRLIKAVASCWEDIQNYRKNWTFLKSSKDFTTVIDQTEYTINDIFGTTVSPVRSYQLVMRNDNQAVLNPMSKITYDLRDLVNEPQTTVAQYAVDDITQSVWMQPPSEATSLRVYYTNNLQTLALDTDVPICHSEFHNCIVYKAVSEVSLFFGSGDLFSLFDKKYQFELGALLRAQNPSVSVRIP